MMNYLDFPLLSIFLWFWYLRPLRPKWALPGDSVKALHSGESTAPKCPLSRGGPPACVLGVSTLDFNKFCPNHNHWVILSTYRRKFQIPGMALRPSHPRGAPMGDEDALSRIAQDRGHSHTRLLHRGAALYILSH